MSSQTLIREAALAGLLALVCLATVAPLAGCGGSSPYTSPEDCAAATVIAYESLQAFRTGGGQLAEPELGHAFTTGRASLPGVPAGCINGATFAMATPLPPGLALDPNTGVVSGTPTAAGNFRVGVAAAGPLLPGTLYGGGDWQVRDPAAFAWSAWDDGAGGGHAVPAGAQSLNALGGSLVLTFGGDTAVITRRSIDGGATWPADTPPAAPPARREFAVADDGGTQLYVAGGTDGTGLLDDVWSFDGSTWLQAVAHAPFGPRRASLLFTAGGHLFLFGGLDATNTALQDLWRSDDGALTWTKLSDAVYGNQAFAWTTTCGGDLGGMPVLITGNLPYGTGSHPLTQVWSSVDGNPPWFEHTLAEADDSPAATLNGGGGQCATLGARLIVTGSTGWWNTVVDVASTSDLDHWAFQPRSNAFLDGLPLPGAAVLDGRLHLVYGTTLYTSQP